MDLGLIGLLLERWGILQTCKSLQDKTPEQFSVILSVELEDSLVLLVMFDSELRLYLDGYLAVVSYSSFEACDIPVALTTSYFRMMIKTSQHSSVLTIGAIVSFFLCIMEGYCDYFVSILLLILRLDPCCNIYIHTACCARFWRVVASCALQISSLSTVCIYVFIQWKLSSNVTHRLMENGLMRFRKILCHNVLRTFSPDPCVSVYLLWTLRWRRLWQMRLVDI